MGWVTKGFGMMRDSLGYSDFNIMYNCLRRERERDSLKREIGRKKEQEEEKNKGRGCPSYSTRMYI